VSSYAERARNGRRTGAAERVWRRLSWSGVRPVGNPPRTVLGALFSKAASHGEVIWPRSRLCNPSLDSASSYPAEATLAATTPRIVLLMILKYSSHGFLANNGRNAVWFHERRGFHAPPVSPAHGQQLVHTNMRVCERWTLHSYVDHWIGIILPTGLQGNGRNWTPHTKEAGAHCRESVTVERIPTSYSRHQLAARHAYLGVTSH
jgi:hypothetical protein